MERRQVPNAPAVNPNLLPSTGGFATLKFLEGRYLPVVFRDRVTENVKCRVSEGHAKD